MKLAYKADYSTALTVPANTFVTVVDSSWASRYYSGGVEINDVVYSFNDNAGKTNYYSLAAGAYSFMISHGSGAGGWEGLSVSNTATEYVKMKVKLSDINSYFNTDGTFTKESIVFNFGSDSKSQSAVLVITSGAVVNAVVPDAQGYVEIYVDKTTRAAIECHYIYDEGTASSTGGASCSDGYAYDFKEYTFQAVDFPDAGLNLSNVPAGTYTLKLSDSSKVYESASQEFTVTESQDVQNVKVVLKKTHTHTADESTWLKDATSHWHKCSTCTEDVKLDEAAHTPGPEATEETPQTCTICGYEIAPVLEHVHSYGTEYKTDEENHWLECRFGDKTELAEHDFKWITDKEATETEVGSKHEECSVCGYKKDAVEIPMIEKEEPTTEEPTTEEPTTEEPTTEAPTTEEPTTEEPTTEEPTTEEPTTKKQETATNAQEPTTTIQASEQASTPITGDDMSSAVWMVILFGSVAVFAGIIVAGKKKNA